MIRPAEAKDLQDIRGLVKEFAKEIAPFYKVKFDIEKVTSSLDYCRKTQLFLVIDIGRIVGGCCGQVVESFLSDEKVYQDLFFYIQPKHRTYTKSLMAELEKKCKERGVNKIVMASFGDNKRLDRFYELLGYRLLEKHFVKGIE